MILVNLVDSREQVVPSNTIQDHPVPSNTFQYHSIPFNTGLVACCSGSNFEIVSCFWMILMAFKDLVDSCLPKVTMVWGSRIGRSHIFQVESRRAIKIQEWGPHPKSRSNHSIYISRYQTISLDIKLNSIS